MKYQQPGHLRQFGVEEELLLVDSLTFKPVPAVASALAGQRAVAESSHLEQEVKQEQIEVISSPSQTMADALAAIREGRRLADSAAASTGARAVAMATSAGSVAPHIVRTSRYLAMESRFGRTMKDQLTCGLHVHVEVASAEEGVAVLDRIRIWLPVLLALSSNSPFWSGTDSGYASYRYQLWNRWPTTGPCEIFGSAAAYRREVARLLETGVPLDPGMIYFDARLSRNNPTVEVRIADVCLEAEHTAAIAALVRAMVQTAVREWKAGRKPRQVPASALRLASWKASKSGVEGDLVHPITGQPRDAAVVIAELLDHVHPALNDVGESSAVKAIVGAIVSGGTGAAAQRRALARTGSLTGVVADAVERTHRLPGEVPPEEVFQEPMRY